MVHYGDPQWYHENVLPVSSTMSRYLKPEDANHLLPHSHIISTPLRPRFRSTREQIRDAFWPKEKSLYVSIDSTAVGCILQ